MRVSEEDIKDKAFWNVKGYQIPKFDRKDMIHNTKKYPTWIHFGGGNIFRAFIAELSQQLLDMEIEKTGIIVASGRDSVMQVYRAHDNLCLSVTLKSDGTISKKVLGSIVQSLVMETECEDWEELKRIFSQKSLQMASFTITEKAYKLKTSDGKYLPQVLEDFQKGWNCPQSYMGKIAALCLERYKHGAYPMALVSMDNYSRNGLQLFEAVRAYAQMWVEKRAVDFGFLEYVEDSRCLSFPWTMIDKITPSPDESVKKILAKDGIEELDIVKTEKNTNSAVFVNAEETGYLVIEDLFPNGRPSLEKAGVIFADRKTVDKTEKMKVCTCLNPLHSALAIFGCLLGYTYIWKEMQDPDLRELVWKIGYEGLPVVKDPGILNPGVFLETVITERFSNPFIPDSPQRIAMDLSQKIPVRFGKTLEAYLEDPQKNVRSLTYIPLVFAGYLRYLMGLDDEGKIMEISPDPLKNMLTNQMKEICLGEKKIPHKVVYPILSDKQIFGYDLYKIGLGDKTEKYFYEMIQAPGAVRKTLRKYL